MAKAGFSYNRNESKVLVRIAKSRGETNRRSVALRSLEPGEAEGLKSPQIPPTVYREMVRFARTGSAAPWYAAG